MNPDTHHKLCHLFLNPDAILQRAGFFKSLDERKSIPGNFVDSCSSHSDAEERFDNFMKSIKLEDVADTRTKVLGFLKVHDNEDDIFRCPPLMTD